MPSQQVVDVVNTLTKISVWLLIGLAFIAISVIVKCWRVDDTRNMVAFSVSVSLGGLVLVGILIYTAGRLLRDE
jgi:ATP/ADP translocase